MATLRIGSAVAILALGSLHYAGAQTSEITLIAPGGIRDAVEQLIPGFEARTGHKVKATFGSGLGTKQQVARGEAFDVPIVQEPYPQVLASGNVVTGSATKLASVAVGIAVKKGAPKPDISTPEAVKRRFSPQSPFLIRTRRAVRPRESVSTRPLRNWALPRKWNPN